MVFDLIRFPVSGENYRNTVSVLLLSSCLVYHLVKISSSKLINLEPLFLVHQHLMNGGKKKVLKPGNNRRNRDYFHKVSKSDKNCGGKEGKFFLNGAICMMIYKFFRRDVTCLTYILSDMSSVLFMQMVHKSKFHGFVEKHL